MFVPKVARLDNDDLGNDYIFSIRWHLVLFGVAAAVRLMFENGKTSRAPVAIS